MEKFDRKSTFQTGLQNEFREKRRLQQSGCSGANLSFQSDILLPFLGESNTMRNRKFKFLVDSELKISTEIDIFIKH